VRQSAKPKPSPDLAKRLKIDPERLHDELCDQPKLYYLASKQRVSAARARANVELELRAAKADVMLKLKQSSPRTSVAVIQAQVFCDETVRELEGRLAECELDEELAKALVEAFRQRRECLGLLMEQNRAEAGAGAVRRKLASTYPGR